VEEPEAATKDLPGDESIFPQVTVEGRRPVVVMAARSAPVMTFGTTVLEAAGFDVVVEASGEAILTSLPKLKPDLILTELLLDDMDAVHFCSQVRKKGAGKAVPILVVSDLPHAPTIRKILSDDCTDFISTPIQWHVLVFRAHRWISLARKLTALQDRKVDHEEVREARDTALKATTEALQLRHYDSLTGLPNRELFVNSVGLALSQRQRLGGHPLVLFLDIENFREVNDLVGRSLGDELLKVVAKRLRNCLREDDLSAPEGKERRGAAFARFTGDQFAILVDGAEGRTLATTVAERLLQRLSEPITIGERQFRLAGRVGVADSVDLEGEGEEELVQRAETAVRYCKEQKGQRVAFFESFMNELVAQRLALTSELRTAIDQEELFLCYQLLMDCRSSLPNGVEALIRWQHPTRGVVPPGEFLAVAEESDLMVEIDRWVLRNGCRQGKRWLDRGIPLKLSLNVSMRFIEEANFAEQVLAILEESGLPAEHLQLELSERGVLPEAGRIMDQLELLASRRIQLAIDDFGTGQTSLSYLRNLPIQCVKVDRSFVSRVPEDAASAAIVSAVVAMSHHLGLKVVAEGVETEEQSDFLRRHRYDELQGFLFSRPQRAKEIEVKIGHLLEEGRAEAGGRLPAVPEEQLPDVAPAVLGEQVPGEMPAVPVDEAASEVSTPTEETDEEDRAAVIETADLPAAAATGDEASPGPPPAAPVPTESGEEVHAAPLSPAMEGESSSHLLRLARRDFLTGLYNRFSFDERLEHAAAHADRYGHKLALLLVDLDDFKYVNDTYGHPVGDALLVQMARQLQSVVRKVDTLARIGGDEFAVIYSEFQEIESVTEFARRFLSVLSEPVQVEGRELRVGGSIGVTVYPEAGSRPKDLLRQADLALYKAKNLGGERSARAVGVPGQVPARGRAANRRDQGRRGAASLAPPRTWRGGSRSVHPPRREHRRDPRTGQLGDPLGLRAGKTLAGELRPGAHRLGEHLSGAVPRRRFRGGRSGSPRSVRSGARQAAPGVERAVARRVARGLGRGLQEAGGGWGGVDARQLRLRLLGAGALQAVPFSTGQDRQEPGVDHRRGLGVGSGAERHPGAGPQDQGADRCRRHRAIGRSDPLAGRRLRAGTGLSVQQAVDRRPGPRAAPPQRRAPPRRAAGRARKEARPAADPRPVAGRILSVGSLAQAAVSS
jgi:diguanylate cyclase (GGDEF)-like protein